MIPIKKVIEKFSFDKIDVIYYINLDHRTDRNGEILEEMKKANIPTDRIQRISAVYKPSQGDLGCSMSHINTLTQFIDSPYDTCIIFEDDFEFLEPNHVESKLQEFMDSGLEFNVCLLAGNVSESNPHVSYPGVRVIKNTATTSGYMVSKKYAKILLANFKEGCKLLEQSYKQGKPDLNNQPYAIDQYWKKLQSQDEWIIFEPKLGKQRKSYSDIMKGEVDYNI